MSPGSTRTTTHLPNCFCQSDKAFEDHFYSINAISAILWNSAKVIITTDYASMKLPGLPMQWWQSIKVLHFKSLNAKFLWKWLHTQTVECVPQHLSEQFSTGKQFRLFISVVEPLKGFPDIFLIDLLFRFRFLVMQNKLSRLSLSMSHLTGTPNPT